MLDYRLGKEKAGVSAGFPKFFGVVEALGAAGLVLPPVTGIAPMPDRAVRRLTETRLTPDAGA